MLQLMTPHPVAPVARVRVPNKRFFWTKRNSRILESILVSFWDQF